MIFINRRTNNSVSMRDPSKNSYSSIQPIAANWAPPIHNYSESAPQVIATGSNGMLWGKPTWYMLHTLAEKIRPEHFIRLRGELLNVIVRICDNLPCPECANHATAYMNRINFDNIQTKGQLKLMLFQFHNSVNAKKNYPLFSFNDLDSTYGRANTTNIITNFFHHFSKTSFSGRMGTENFHRTRTVRDIKGWLRGNTQYFEI